MAVELNEMNTLKKEDIIFYLNNYVSVMTMAIANPTIEFRKIHDYIAIEKYGPQFANEGIYYNTLRIYEFLLYKKLFSYYYDSAFPNLKEKMIKDIELPKNIFVNFDDENRFSKKQIINFIRNALNHNDSNNRELYHIVQDSSKLILDINLLQTKPIPFHVQIDMSDFLKLEKSIINSTYNPDITLICHSSDIDYLNPDISEELKKIYFRRYNFQGKDDNTISERFRKLLSNGVVDINKLDVITHSNDDYKDYQLTISQQIKLEQDIRDFEKSVGIPFNWKLLSYELFKVVQFGSAKYFGLLVDFFICDWYLGRDNKSLIDFQKDVIDYSNGKNMQNNPLNKIADIRNLDFLLYKAWDFDQFTLNSLEIYMNYIFDTYIKDEKIDINGKLIDREKIRDSFVHGRYYVGSFNKYHFMDSENGRKNEVNINWSETIKLDDILKFCYSQTKEITKGSKINVPLSYNKDKQVIEFMKNGIGYFCLLNNFKKELDENLDINVIYKVDKNGISQVDNSLEFDMFIKEIDNKINSMNNDERKISYDIYDELKKILLSNKDTNLKSNDEIIKSR